MKTTSRQSWEQAFLPALHTAYWFLVLCLAFLALVYFCRTSGVGGHGPAKIERILAGTAYRPYAFRVLLPTVANVLAPLLDAHLALRIGLKSEAALGAGFFLSTLDGSTYPSQVVLILGMMYVSLVGFAITMRHLIGCLGYSAVVQYLAPLALLVGTTVFMGFGYIYDFTSLFLFSLGILLMSSRRWLAYLLVFTLATLNKETSIFLVLVFVLHFLARLPRREFVLLSLGQLGLYGVLQGAIRYVFRNNPGTAFQWHLVGQLDALKQAAIAMPRAFVLTCALLVVIAALIIYGWSRKPLLLRSAAWILPCFLILYAAWGYPGEIRVMLEVYPIVGLLMVPPQLLEASKRLKAVKALRS